MEDVFFIHIPRTGGNSIASAFLANDHFVQYMHDLRDPSFQFANEQILKGNQAFTFIRNPLERTFSAYNYLKTGGNNFEDGRDAYHLGLKFLDFDEFIKKKLRQAATWQLHFLPQNAWIRALPNVRIFSFESIQEEVLKACQEFNLTYHELPQLNANKTMRPAISNKSKRIIMEIYKQDYHLI